MHLLAIGFVCWVILFVLCLVSLPPTSQAISGIRRTRRAKRHPPDPISVMRSSRDEIVRLEHQTMAHWEALFYEVEPSVCDWLGPKRRTRVDWMGVPPPEAVEPGWPRRGYKEYLAAALPPPEALLPPVSRGYLIDEGCVCRRCVEDREGYRYRVGGMR